MPNFFHTPGHSINFDNIVDVEWHEGGECAVIWSNVIDAGSARRIAINGREEVARLASHVGYTQPAPHVEPTPEPTPIRADDLDPMAGNYVSGAGSWPAHDEGKKEFPDEPEPAKPTHTPKKGTRN